MRPVNRAVPAMGSYPADFKDLSSNQKDIVKLLHAMLFETETADCERMAAELMRDYSINMAGQRAAKRRKTSGGAIDIKILEVNWNTYADLQTEHADAQQAFNNKPAPHNITIKQKEEVIQLYKTLKGIALRKKNVVETAQQKLPPIYGRSRRQLITNIGQYCSYCELPLATSLAVEHMLPKSDFPLVSLVWNNFLLACPLCNSYKNDKPKRFTGTWLSPNLGAHTPPVFPANPPTLQEEGWIKDGALNSYLWPNDAVNYTSFGQFYQYQMTKVIYDAAGNRTASEVLNSAQVMQSVRSNQFKFENDSGNAVIASLRGKLDEFNSFDSAEILAALQQDEYSNVLVQCLRLHRFVLDPAVVSRGKIEHRTIDNRKTEVTERRKYLLELSGNPRGAIRVPVKEVDANDDSNPMLLFTIDLTKSEQIEFRARLASGLLPEQLKAAFANDPYKVDVLKDSISVSGDRTDIYITIDKNFLINNDGGILELYGVFKFQIELHLAAVVGPLSDQANQVINDLKLNNVNAAEAGNKLTDRRMIKRTRTWFIAVESLQRLYQAVLSNNPIEPYAELLTGITETAKATGFWSVWWTMFYDGLAEAPPNLRTAIMQFLTNVNNFPGTR